MDIKGLHPAAKKPLLLWYDEPCAKTAEIFDNGVTDRKGWDSQSLPIGNGYAGASVWGRIDTERIQIADKTLANPYRTNPAGRCLHSCGGLSSFADVYIDIGHEFEKTNGYRRSLDIRTAAAAVDYELDGVRYHTEYIASYPDNIIAVRMTASQSGKVSFRLRPENPYVKPYGAFEGDGQGRTGSIEADAAARTITLGGRMEY